MPRRRNGARAVDVRSIRRRSGADEIPPSRRHGSQRPRPISISASTPGIVFEDLFIMGSTVPETPNAIDLNAGVIRWKIAFGEFIALAAKGITNTGSDNYGGPVV